MTTITLLPKVLMAILAIAGGRPNPLYEANPTPQTLVVSCYLLPGDEDADGVVYTPSRLPTDAFERLNATPEDPYRMYFARSICKKLNAFATHPRLKGDDFSDSAVEMAWTLRVATHESAHVFFFRNYPGYGHTEPQADCRGVMTVNRFARKLGASKKVAKRVYRLNTEIGLFDDYASACASGHPYKPPKIGPPPPPLKRPPYRR